MQALEKEFVVVGGIKERMYSARTGYRKNQDNKIREMESIISKKKRLLVNYMNQILNCKLNMKS